MPCAYLPSEFNGRMPFNEEYTLEQRVHKSDECSPGIEKPHYRIKKPPEEKFRDWHTPRLTVRAKIAAAATAAMVADFAVELGEAPEAIMRNLIEYMAAGASEKPADAPPREHVLKVMAASAVDLAKTTGMSSADLRSALAKYLGQY